jgi:hypothetical protein
MWTTWLRCLLQKQVDQKDDDVWKAKENRAWEWEKWRIIDLRLGFLFLEMELTDVEREMQAELTQWGTKNRTIQQWIIREDRVVGVDSEYSEISAREDKGIILFMNMLFPFNYTQFCFCSLCNLKTHQGWKSNILESHLSVSLSLHQQQTISLFYDNVTHSWAWNANMRKKITAVLVMTGVQQCFYSMLHEKEYGWCTEKIREILWA